MVLAPSLTSLQKSCALNSAKLKNKPLYKQFQQVTAQQHKAKSTSLYNNNSITFHIKLLEHH